jgi:hypothetical protein
VANSRTILEKMEEARQICRENLGHDIKHKYDFEIFKTVADLITHTARTYVDLSDLEYAIAEAHRQRILDHQKTIDNLEKAQKIIEGQLARREKTLQDLVVVWERTRLPKGMSTENKKYFFEQDRTVHYANRAADMTYLIVDEQKLDLEGYLSRLVKYTEGYRERFLKKN